MISEAKPVIVITMGDPSGVGPEVIAKALMNRDLYRISRPLILGDRLAMERAIAVTGADFGIEVVDDDAEVPESNGNEIALRTISHLSSDDMEYGKPSRVAGDSMYLYIQEAVRLCLTGKAAAMATAPINKEAMNRAGHKYPGHTELLAELTGTDEYVMMLAGERLRVALVTIHEALADVPRLLTRERVLSTIRIVDRDVKRYFRKNPRLAVLALNPHSGEGGLFGNEETEIIAPAVSDARKAGIEAVGPLSADTLFHFAARGDYDAVVCMYHDQGLIPLKLLHFDDGINMTLGLPIIRTSVDHGTAYNLAGTGKASEASMTAAIRTAARMAAVKAELTGC